MSIAKAFTLRQEAAHVLALSDPDEVPLDQPLQTLGLDSLMAVEMRNNLSARLEKHLPMTLLFDHPTLRALLELLLAHEARGGQSGSNDPSAGRTSETGTQEGALEAADVRQNAADVRQKVADGDQKEVAEEVARLKALDEAALIESLNAELQDLAKGSRDPNPRRQ